MSKTEIHGVVVAPEQSLDAPLKKTTHQIDFRAVDAKPVEANKPQIDFRPVTGEPVEAKPEPPKPKIDFRPADANQPTQPEKPAEEKPRIQFAKIS